MILSNDVKHYPIGAVVKLTGLTSHNIRVWEKRHQAVVAGRLASGRRYYTQEQVERLLLLKACIECGFSIRELAALEDHQLQARLDHHTSQPHRTLDVDDLTVGVFSPSNIIGQIDKIPALHVKLLETQADLSNIHQHQATLQERPHILIVEAPSLQDTVVSSIQQLLKLTNPLLVVLIYRFASRTQLAKFRHQGVRLLQAPIDGEALYFLLSDFLSSHGYLEKNTLKITKPYPKHLYSHQQLTKIIDLPTALDCECPRHLVDLLKGLKAFEDYSGQCINKEDKDAALHGKIQFTTATARLQLEQLLQEVLAAEGVQL